MDFLWIIIDWLAQTCEAARSRLWRH